MAVELAGGTPMLMEEGTDEDDDDILIAPNTCVMQSDPEDQTLSSNARDWIRHVIDLLKK